MIITSNNSSNPENYLYVDVGGGSTEINLISEGELKSSRSYNIGTVRMLSGMVKNEEKEQMHTDLEVLAKEYAPIHIIGSGGNINKLFRLADKKTRNNYFFHSLPYKIYIEL